jgi:CDP-2,3-bis-(O-geranylgeranyl)-sn-glycerol synthase
MSISPDPLVCAAFVVLAFVPAGLAHSLWLRSACAEPFRIPIDGGRTWRGQRLLGDNKTWAGFLVLPPACAVTFTLLRLVSESISGSWCERLWPLAVASYALLGGWTALGFMAGELPNSFVKRQFGVAPGAAAPGRAAGLVSFVIDRLDSLAGALLALALVVPVDGWFVFYLLLVVPGLHWLFSALLCHLGVKRRLS